MQSTNNTSCISFTIWEKVKNLSLGKPAYGEKGRCTFMKQLAGWFKVCLLNGENTLHLHLNISLEGKGVLSYHLFQILITGLQGKCLSFRLSDIYLHIHILL